MAKRKKIAPAPALVLTSKEKEDKLKSLADEIAAKDSALESQGGRLGNLSIALTKLIGADGLFVNKQHDALSLVDQLGKVKVKIEEIQLEKQPLLKEQKLTSQADVKD